MQSSKWFHRRNSCSSQPRRFGWFRLNCFSRWCREKYHRGVVRMQAHHEWFYISITADSQGRGSAPYHGNGDCTKLQWTRRFHLLQLSILTFLQRRSTQLTIAIPHLLMLRAFSLEKFKFYEWCSCWYLYYCQLRCYSVGSFFS